MQGRIVAAVSPVLYASDTGTITFLVESGDSVKTGQTIASIESPELQNRLLQERSRLNSLKVESDRQQITTQQQQLENQKSLDSASITLKAAQRELDRAQRAFERGAMTEVDLDRARDNIETAEVLHRHAVLDAELDNNRLDFERPGTSGECADTELTRRWHCRQPAGRTEDHRQPQPAGAKRC